MEMCSSFWATLYMTSITIPTNTHRGTCHGRTMVVLWLMHGSTTMVNHGWTTAMTTMVGSERQTIRLRHECEDVTCTLIKRWLNRCVLLLCNMFALSLRRRRDDCKGDKEGTCRTLDTAPVSETTRKITAEAPRNGTRCRGIHSFTCTPTNEMKHICLCLPSRSWSSFTDPRGMEG